MFGLFKKKPEKIIQDFEKKVFRQWKISSKDTATRIRFRAALGMCCSGIMHSTQPDPSVLPELVYGKLCDSLEHEKCKIYKIFSNAYKVEAINFSEGIFLVNADLKNGNVFMKGSDILVELANSFGDEGVGWIVDRGKGKSGAGYASALFLRDLTIGKVKSDLQGDIKLGSDLYKFVDQMIHTFKT